MQCQTMALKFRSEKDENKQKEAEIVTFLKKKTIALYAGYKMILFFFRLHVKHCRHLLCRRRF